MTAPVPALVMVEVPRMADGEPAGRVRRDDGASGT
jgi:hypothetical protein